MLTPVLLLSSDEQAVQVVSQVLTELGLAVERPAIASSAIREVDLRSFSALVVDCDDLESAKLMFKALRSSKLNRGIPAIAVVNGGTGLPVAFRLGAEFVISKPASLDQVRHTLRAASSKMKKAAGSIATAPVPAVPARAIGAAAGAANSTSARALVSSPSAVPAKQPSAPAPGAPSLPVKPAVSASAQSSGSAAATASARVVPAQPKISAAHPAPVSRAGQPSLPKTKLDDPILADLDDMENPGAFSPPPFTQLKMKPRRPVMAFVCVLIVLAGTGGYAAWMMRPDFRNFVMTQYVEMRARIGKPVPSPAPEKAKPGPVEITPPATPAAPEESAPLTIPAASDGAAPEVPAAESAPPASPSAANSSQLHPVPSSANPQH